MVLYVPTIWIRRLNLLVAVWLFEFLIEAIATCSRPALPENSYSQTNKKDNYAVNETFEILCMPRYDASNDGNLVCGANGQWSLSPPECTPKEGIYPWWMLLVAVTLVILLVSCILPRVIQCCLNKSKNKDGNAADDVESQAGADDYGYGSGTGGKGQNRQNDGYDYDDYDNDDDDDDGDFSSETNRRFGKGKKMNNMEFMTKLHKDVDKKTLKRATKNAVF